MSLHSPLISVIIPFYNAQAFLRQTIESVLFQTFEDWELILVDDGSSDQSACIARDYAETYPDKIYYIEHPGHGNKGQYISRLEGAKQARADFLAFLDADDLWLEEKLGFQWEIIQSMTPRPAMVYGPACYFFEDKSQDYIQPLPRKTGLVTHPELFMEFQRSDFSTTPCPSSILVTRSVFLELRAYAHHSKSLGPFEDQILSTHISAFHDIYIYDRVLFRYRQHDQSCCSRAERQNRLNSYHLNYIKWLIDFYRQSGIATDFMKAKMKTMAWLETNKEPC